MDSPSLSRKRVEFSQTENPSLKGMAQAWLYALLIFSTGCTQPTQQLPIRRVEFVNAARRDANYSAVGLRQGSYYIFSFHQFYYTDYTDTVAYSRSLYIHFPAGDTSFVFARDSTHLYQHMVDTTRSFSSVGHVEAIDSAQISGRLLADGRWQVHAKTKYFDFTQFVVPSLNALEKVNFAL